MQFKKMIKFQTLIHFFKSVKQSTHIPPPLNFKYIGSNRITDSLKQALFFSSFCTLFSFTMTLVSFDISKFHIMIYIKILSFEI